MNETDEAEFLLSKASFPGLKKLLQQHIAYLKITAEQSTIKEPAVEQPTVVASIDEPAVPVPAAPAKVTAPVPAPAVVPTPPAPTRAPTTKGPSTNFITIENFAWDQGEYGSPTVSIFVDLPGVGAVKDSVDFSCTKSTFDLKVTGLNGKNYRLLKDNLDKDIVVKESKILVKKDKIVIKLKKVKGDYSYENWANLTSKKKRDSASEAEKKSNPMGGIMDMMKDMYDDGDENMKKIIGEAMMKSQRGETAAPPAFDSEM